MICGAGVVCVGRWCRRCLSLWWRCRWWCFGADVGVGGVGGVVGGVGVVVVCGVCVCVDAPGGVGSFGNT